jgi:hypothetical protein
VDDEPAAPKCPAQPADEERPRKRRLVKLADQPAEEGRASSTKEGEMIRVLDESQVFVI